MRSTLLLVKKAKWLDLLASPKARVRVTLAGTPTRFATPREWDTRVKRLDEHLVYFFAKKSARAEVAGEAFACPRGSCCWVTPGTPFRFRSSQSPLVWRFRFSVTMPGRTVPVAPRGAPYFFASAPALAETIGALLVELPNRDRWQPAALRSLLAQFSILFFRSTGPQNRPRVLTGPQRNAITALVEQGHAGELLQPRDLANAAGLTLDYFSRVFHRSYGISPREWLVRQRLAHALVLLQETPLRVGEIAQRLGYANTHLFSRQFSACYGASPRAHR